MDIENLVRKAQKGNDKTFLMLYQQHEAEIYRTAYMYYQGYTFDAIAEILELPLGTAKTILYRGLSKLRKSVKER
ncbi:hypothetical protein WJ0W_002075 [Paenibacillus melissococcoides]|uniref:RNA polymerase sigma-70 region 4 domain-containing protein n=1 Tax=Paenibacillus melissococcoides TaxID=2912268 RepID=A0ABM9FZY3_9BACL|nr:MULTISPECIES: sigma factor-like helix-turn-helix DNA-binding protein [Paenibacillus]MEB9892608.1 sigma factor-like helix-turn-helix DNA-binding protein [Bacillus cereus]CAH8244844.1 hypothetical protein WJ0W_002075 [Paenibacillus melissococcoides]CAH8709144.1 hypothetical protein WDD9_002157 [Paenibacillus melissococcoides]CAH8709900.1 hypothetical protein HTL2_002445 [Paenibacillus melissococcoides]GIO82393.1 hypothetical protein J6TS7_60030 [Paenibacillus dendritiformis]